MRDYLLFAVAAVLLILTFKNPFIGILSFAWVSLMNPHRLAYGSAVDFPFAGVFAGMAILCLFLSRDKKKLPLTSVTITLMMLVAWMNFTSLFALEPEFVWQEWSRVMKTLLMIFVTILAIRTKNDIVRFAWVIGLSLAFYGAKGGVFTIISGGNFHVYGPEGSYINDNNSLALALVMALPIIRYVQLTVVTKWLRLGMLALVALTAISAAGSYSRGALVAGGAMFFSLWAKSRQKMRTGFALLIICSAVFLVMPQNWFDRMGTIDNYEKDASSMGRINAWKFAINVARDNVTGGGFSVFTTPMFRRYAPDPLNHHAAHSIYFQVLGEHGFVGLTIFVLLLFFSWRTGSRIQLLGKDKAEFKWATDLAAACQVSIIGFAVGGAFLTMAYYDLYYFIIALLVGTEKVMVNELKMVPPLSGNAKAKNY